MVGTAKSDCDLPLPTRTTDAFYFGSVCAHIFNYSAMNELYF
jgi:hypothetical protein